MGYGLSGIRAKQWSTESEGVVGRSCLAPLTLLCPERSDVEPWRQAGRSPAMGSYPANSPKKTPGNHVVRCESKKGLFPPQDNWFLLQPFITVASWLVFQRNNLNLYCKWFLKKYTISKQSFQLHQSPWFHLYFFPERNIVLLNTNQLRLSCGAKNYGTIESSKLVCQGQGSSTCSQTLLLL